MKRFVARMVVAVSVLVVGAGAGAQPGPGAGRGGPGPHRGLYDPSTVETVAGEAVRVERGAGAGRGGGGVHLVLRTDAKETISVRLGPASYVDRQALTIASGDRIEVKGSRVTIGGQPAIVAAEVRKGEQKLLLRDDGGIPYWSGGGRRAPP